MDVEYKTGVALKAQLSEFAGIISKSFEKPEPMLLLLHLSIILIPFYEVYGFPSHVEGSLKDRF